MKPDFARQPLVPAFMTLLLIAVAAVYGYGVHTPVIPETVAIAGLSIRPAGQVLADFQATHPGWAQALAGLLILLAGMCVGRFSARYNLYSVGTCLALPLFGIIACGVNPGDDYLPALSAATLLAFSSKHFNRSMSSGHTFDALFRASLYLSVSVLITPVALPLLLLLPFAVLLFGRTLRELIVALAGLALAPLLLCYLNWGAGGSFFAPLEQVARQAFSGPLFQLLHTMTLAQLIFTGGILLLDLIAVFSFLSDSYAAGTKPRYILWFNIGQILLVTLALCAPAATPGTLALLAVPSSVLLPFFFVRTHRSITLPLYLILLATALAGIFLQ